MVEVARRATEIVDLLAAVRNKNKLNMFSAYAKPFLSQSLPGFRTSRSKEGRVGFRVRFF